MRQAPDYITSQAPSTYQGQKEIMISNKYEFKYSHKYTGQMDIAIGQSGTDSDDKYWYGNFFNSNQQPFALVSIDKFNTIIHECKTFKVDVFFTG